MASGTVAGYASASFDASDNVGVRTARLLIDGGAVSTADFACDYTRPAPCVNHPDGQLAANTRSLADGIHNLQVEVVDPAGNVTRSPSRSFTVNNTVPDLEVGGALRELADNPLTGDTYEVWAEATATSSGVRSIELQLNGARVAFVERPCADADCDLDLEWDFLRENHAVGHYELVATARDWAGRSTTERFSFDLSSDRTPDPNDSSPLSATLVRTPGTDGCPRLTQLLGDPERARGAASDASSTGVRETTLTYADGSYLVIRCTPTGRLVKAQHVGPVPTPDGVRMLLWSQTELGASEREYVTAYPSYGDPSASRIRRAWQRHRHRAGDSLLAPTPGVDLATPIQVAAVPRGCEMGAELHYNNHSIAGTDWRYYIVRSSFPPEFDTVTKRDRVQERVRDGIRTWNQGRNDCHYRRFTGFGTALLGSTPPPGEADANLSVIEFVDTIDCGDEASDAIGCTTTTRWDYSINTEAGPRLKVRSADIAFLRSNAWYAERGRDRCLGATDLHSFAAHEVGHVVGLDDSTASVNTWQTMYKQTEDCEFRKRRLGRSDWLGLKRLYTLVPG